MTTMIENGNLSKAVAMKSLEIQMTMKILKDQMTSRKIVISCHLRIYLDILKPNTLTLRLVNHFLTVSNLKRLLTSKNNHRNQKTPYILQGSFCAGLMKADV